MAVNDFISELYLFFFSILFLLEFLIAVFFLLQKGDLYFLHDISNIFQVLIHAIYCLEKYIF